MLFTVKDYQGNLVSLSEKVWFKKLLDPMFGHPEVKSYLPEIKLTVRGPDFVYWSRRDPRSKLFYKAKVAKDKFLDCYLVVVVKYVQEADGLQGYISTVMFNRSLPKKGKLIWQKEVSI